MALSPLAHATLLKRFNSLVTGMNLRIHRLCAHQKDIGHWLKKFFEHLLDRGHHNERILPLLNSAISNAHTFFATSDAYHLLLKSKKAEASHSQVFYKLKFRPGGPQSPLTQRLCRDCVLQPPGKPHISRLCNQRGDYVKIDRLYIAYSRHHIIGSLLSYQKICNRPGPKYHHLFD